MSSQEREESKFQKKRNMKKWLLEATGHKASNDTEQNVVFDFQPLKSMQTCLQAEHSNEKFHIFLEWETH